ncbi:MAG: hypothetical protein JXA82_11045 [Sedimentisphaerales bacterium]|nr:hypothetical protein [Sedimentisphaerales bacterium]
MFHKTVLSFLSLLPVISYANPIIIDFENTHSLLKSNQTNAIPTAYAGFNWSGNFRLMTSDYNQSTKRNSGYENGLVGTVVAYTSGRAGVNTVQFNGPVFTFLGANITSAWKNDQDFTVIGLRDNQVLYFETCSTSSDQLYWFNFNFPDIDTLRIIPGTKGTDIGPARGNHLVIDNITIVPDSDVYPSTASGSDPLDVSAFVESFASLASAQKLVASIFIANQLTILARSTYASDSNQVSDPVRLRLINEMQHIVTNYMTALVTPDIPRPTDADLIEALFLYAQSARCTDQMMHILLSGIQSAQPSP